MNKPEPYIDNQGIPQCSRSCPMYNFDKEYLFVRCEHEQCDLPDESVCIAAIKEIMKERDILKSRLAELEQQK